MSIVNLIGKSFYRLKVIGLIGSIKGHRYWKCLCECGTETTASTENLTSENTRSCGCLKKEAISRPKTHGLNCGGKRHEDYAVWCSMVSRCHNQNDDRHDDYGGRGIKVCDRWRSSFAAFLEDMGERPSPKHSIDRFPNNNGNYEPGNCRWATQTEQQRNRRDNVMFTINGQTKCLAEWAELHSINYYTLHARIARGMPFEKAISLPVRRCAKPLAGLNGAKL